MVTLYGKNTSSQMQRFISERRNDLLELDERIALSTSYDSIVNAAVIVVSIPAQAFRGFLEEISILDIKNKIIVLCMKGVEIGTGKRLSEIAKENLDPSSAEFDKLYN